MTRYENEGWLEKYDFNPVENHTAKTVAVSSGSTVLLSYLAYDALKQGDTITAAGQASAAAQCGLVSSVGLARLASDILEE